MTVIGMLFFQYFEDYFNLTVTRRSVKNPEYSVATRATNTTISTLCSQNGSTLVSGALLPLTYGVEGVRKTVSCNSWATVIII